MKFRSPNETPIRVALTSGHAAVIGHEWRELPEIFHRDALAQGAQCDATHIDNPEPPSINGGEQANGGQPSEDDAYREAILLMIERDEEGDFVASTGLPNLKALEKLVGFRVNKERAYAAFHQLKAEADAAGDTDGGEQAE